LDDESLTNRGDSKAKTNSSDKAVLYQEADGAKYEVDLPLTSSVNVQEMMAELRMPSYVDLEYFPMRNAIGVIWASQKADCIHKMYPRAFEKQISNKPIPALMFGGAAMKICCEHSNGKGGLSRTIKDADFIVPKSQGSSFCKLLLGIERAFGTQFKYFRTKGDLLFNAMRQGERYRVRTVNGVTEEGLPTVTVLDIFCDSIDLRHKIEVKDAFDRPRENLFTIGLEYLILSKAQFIMDLPKTDLHLLEEHGQAFRVLPYQWYSPDKVVLGMEEKDAKDVYAIFLDHSIGAEKGEINSDKLRKILEKDKKLALTVTLNLQNLVSKPSLIEKWLEKSEVSTVLGRMQSLLNVLPKIDKKWNKPWWNTAVETPLIQ
jgi:hypothetical protein